MSTLNIILQPVEQGFTDSIRGRAKAFYIGEIQFSAAPLAAYNAQAVLVAT
jgi:hypothetical protein